MAKTYQVRVTNEFRSMTSAGRRTAGLVIDSEGYTGELTSKQLEELKADRYILLTNADGSEIVEEASETAEEETEAEEAATEVTEPEESSSEDNETAPAKPADLSKLTRAKLEELAKEAGVEATDQYNSKADLIAAIEAKQSQTEE